MNLKTFVGGANFNLADPLGKKTVQRNRKACHIHAFAPTAGCGSCDIPKDDDKPYTSQYLTPPGTESECICEVTAFGMVVNEKCTYSHKA